MMPASVMAKILHGALTSTALDATDNPGVRQITPTPRRLQAILLVL